MRICAIADLHGHLPPTPECDLLLIAGDICPDRLGPNTPWARNDGRVQQGWFKSTFIPWLKAQPAKAVYCTWGNHDWMPRPTRSWADLHDGIGLVKIDELVFHPMPADPDPEILGGGVLKLWFSPWSNQFMDWAWMDAPSKLAEVYAKIPAGTDIIVSHQPPYGYGDTVDKRFLIGDRPVEHLGSKELLTAINRVAPKFVICGHIHGGFGCYSLGATTIHNVALVDDAYRLIHAPTVIDL
jgi:hypothetical protein